MGKIHAKVDTYLDDKFCKTMRTKRKDTIERKEVTGSKEASFNNSSTCSYYEKEILNRQITKKPQKSQSSQKSQIKNPLYNLRYQFDIGKLMNKNSMRLMRRSLCVNSKLASLKKALPFKSVSVNMESVLVVKPNKIENLPEKEITPEAPKKPQSVSIDLSRGTSIAEYTSIARLEEIKDDLNKKSHVKKIIPKIMLENGIMNSNHYHGYMGFYFRQACRDALKALTTGRSDMDSLIVSNYETLSQYNLEIEESVVPELSKAMIDLYKSHVAQSAYQKIGLEDNPHLLDEYKSK
jgi:hypothetical protein